MVWEIERGADGLYDIVVDGRVDHVALDRWQVENLLESHNVHDDDVEGDWPPR